MKTHAENDVGRIIVDVNLTNYSDRVLAENGVLAAEKVRTVRIEGLVDTGASYLVLPKKTATELGLPAMGTVAVRYADRRRAQRPLVQGVQLELLGRQGIFKAIVEAKRKEALIGAIVLEDLDLIVDCRTQTVHPRDPKQILAEIE